jgi:hypothetical protein
MQVGVDAATMKRRCRKPDVLQLHVSSQNLREVLLEAVQQPDGVQEQVAEVVKGMLTSLRYAQVTPCMDRLPNHIGAIGL